MDSNIYRMTLQFEATGESQPTPAQMAEHLQDYLENLGVDVYGKYNLNISDVEVVPDPMDEAETPKEMARAALNFIEMYAGHLRRIIRGCGAQETPLEGVSKIEYGAAFTRGAIRQIEECLEGCGTHGSEEGGQLMFQKMRLEDAPDEVLRFIAQKLEISSSETMDRESLLAALHHKMHGEREPGVN